MEAYNKTLEEEITEINKKRKFSQISQQATFEALKHKLNASYEKNSSLEREVLRMEYELLESSSLAQKKKKTSEEQGS